MNATTLAQALNAAEAKAIPPRGLPSERPATVLYHDRDGKVYDAAIERKYELTADIPIGGDKFQKHTRVCCDLRVNFSHDPNRPDWKPVFGISEREHLLNTARKTFFQRAPAAAAPNEGEAAPEVPATAPAAEDAAPPPEKPKPAKKPKQKK